MFEFYENCMKLIHLNRVTESISYKCGPETLMIYKDLNPDGPNYMRYINGSKKEHMIGDSTPVGSYAECIDFCNAAEGCQSISYKKKVCYLSSIDISEDLTPNNGDGWKSSYKFCEKGMIIYI